MQDEATIARRFAALADLGFRRADVVPVTNDAVPVERRCWKVVMTRPAMGTLVTVTAIGPDRTRAETAIGAAFEEMDRLIGLFSRFESDSAIAQLNGLGQFRDPPPELKRVVTTALDYHRLSHGAFDMTITPVLDLFEERGGRAARLPDLRDMREALARVGSSHVEVGWRRIRFARDGMRITLDGIAKGYIVDGMAETLERHGIRRYLINAGGDIRARRCKEGGRPWAVAVQDPDRDERLADAIPLTSGAVATSGSYRVHFDEDQTFHHIVDGRIGRSPRHAASVSVTAPTATAADALATSVFVLGPAAGVALVERLRGCACLIMDRAGRRWASSRWCSTRTPDGEWVQ